MELDDLKSAWTQYDKKLNDNLQFNEMLLRKMNLESSKREMNTPLKSEIFSVAINSIMLLFVIVASLRFTNELKFFVPGIICSILTAALLAFAIIKTTLLSNIDYYNASVLDLQKSVSLIKKKIAQFKIYEFIIFPFLGITALPILEKAIKNLDMYQNPKLFTIAVFAMLAIGYPMMMWVYKHWYEKKIKNTEQFLKEIEAYKSEA
jgi:hypothetical protein